MRMLKDFKCPDCGKVSEVFTAADYILCECGGTAQKQISLPTIKLEGISGAFPGAHDRWARIREDNARIKAKRNS